MDFRKRKSKLFTTFRKGKLDEIIIDLETKLSLNEEKRILIDKNKFH